MCLLKITLTPTEPYFLGSERCSIFDDENATQRSLVAPYFLRSGQLPAQTALFGITRYLGIRNPSADMKLTNEDKAAIGTCSYDLTKPDQTFGSLLGISPLLLTYRELDEVRHLVPAPMHHKIDKESSDFNPFRNYQVTETLDGLRWIPDKDDYSAKDFDPRRFLCLETGQLEDDPFGSHIQVGINLQQNRGSSVPSGFFKREMARLNSGYSFTWFARLADGATSQEYGYSSSGSRMVFVGQGNSAFSARWETVSEIEIRSRLPGFCLPGYGESNNIPDNFRNCFPSSISLNTGSETADKQIHYAYVVSDLYYPSDPVELRANCVFSITQLRDQRGFATRYATGRNMKHRYRKARELRKTISAGSVFLFNSLDQQKEFKQLLEGSEFFTHGLKAGLNYVYYSN